MPSLDVYARSKKVVRVMVAMPDNPSKVLRDGRSSGLGCGFSFSEWSRRACMKPSNLLPKKPWPEAPSGLVGEPSLVELVVQKI